MSKRECRNEPAFPAGFLVPSGRDGLSKEARNPARQQPSANPRFDASHVPCAPDKEANPARLSLWEIHPVYAIDVCSETTIAACRIDDESLWTPLNEFEP